MLHVSVEVGVSISRYLELFEDENDDKLVECGIISGNVVVL